MIAPSKNLVVKNNVLIESSFRLPINAHRLLLMAISKVNPRSAELNVIQFTKKELISIYSQLNNDKRNDIEKLIDEATDALMGRFIFTRVNSEINDFKKINWVEETSYINEVITIKFTQGMKPYLLDMNEKYTQYKIINIANLTNTIQIRFYELFVQSIWKSQKSRKISKEDLKLHLGIDKKSYAKISHLKNRIIDPSMDIINKSTNINVHYRDIKELRSIVGFEFFFTEKNIIEQNTGKNSNPDPDIKDSSHTLKKLIKLGITKEAAEDVIASHDEEYILDKIKQVEIKKSSEGINNVPGFLLSSIKNDYQSKPKNTEPKIKKIKTKKEKDQEKNAIIDKLKSIKENHSTDEMDMLISDFYKANKNNAVVHSQTDKKNINNPIIKMMFDKFLLEKFK